MFREHDPLHSGIHAVRMGHGPCWPSVALLLASSGVRRISCMHLTLAAVYHGSDVCPSDGSAPAQGLQQPFQDAYETARRQVVVGTIAAGVAGLLGGYLLGRFTGRGDGRAR